MKEKKKSGEQSAAAEKPSPVLQHLILVTKFMLSYVPWCVPSCSEAWVNALQRTECTKVNEKCELRFDGERLFPATFKDNMHAEMDKDK